MTKDQLVTRVARQTGIAKTDTKLVIEELITTVKRVVSNGEFLYLRKFGTFCVKNRKAKVGRNIKKNIPLIIPTKRIPYFKPSSHFFIPGT